VTDDEIKTLATHLVETNRGVGMSPPFYAETASNKGDLDWPHWIVRNVYCNSLGMFMPRAIAERLAPAMNATALTSHKDAT
jgi:hypothetical protein